MEQTDQFIGKLILTILLVILRVFLQPGNRVIEHFIKQLYEFIVGFHILTMNHISLNRIMFYECVELTQSHIRKSAHFFRALRATSDGAKQTYSLERN
ncbi:hypothetical protein WL94_16045 [Burkholderia cepacia]|nr:hypothetical protein WL94_16045 [Burkholderia cepacia]